MRVLAACLLGVLGLSGLTTMAACSDATDSGGAAGASGASASGAGAGGKAPTAGSSSTAGTAGSGCSFATPTCNDCISQKCKTQVTACSGDDGCLAALNELPGCLCGPSPDPETCQNTFVTDGGDTAFKLAECYTLNCESVCQ